MWSNQGDVPSPITVEISSGGWESHSKSIADPFANE